MFEIKLWKVQMATPPVATKVSTTAWRTCSPWNFAGCPNDYVDTVGMDHGRIEPRCCWTTDDPDRECCDLVSLVCIESERRFGDRVTTDVRIFISSMPPNFLTASLPGMFEIESKKCRERIVLGVRGPFKSIHDRGVVHGHGTTMRTVRYRAWPECSA